MEFGFLVVVIVVAAVASIAWRFIRAGSVTGALLGGSIESELGEIPLERGALQSRTLKVYAMKSRGGEAFVGVAVISKALLGAGIVPFKLSAVQAQELATLLTRACEFRDTA